MKAFVHCLFAAVILVGCSTPSAVKELALETRVAASHMGDVHAQDLSTLAAFDRARVAQFQHMLNQYIAVRAQMANVFNEELDRAKQQSLAELDHAFDQRAEQIMTTYFWAGFREQADKDLNNFLLTTKERSAAKKAASDIYFTDFEAQSQALVAARQLYLSSALNYQTIESSFAEVSRRIDQTRSEYHAANEKLFADIKKIEPQPIQPALADFSLTDNSAEINQRVSDLKGAYAKIDSAHAVMIQYLDENNPGAEFFAAAGKALIGVTETPADATKSPVPLQPASSKASELPGLEDLLGMFSSGLKQVQSQKSTGAGALDQTINQLINNCRPLVRVVSTQSANNSDLGSAIPQKGAQ